LHQCPDAGYTLSMTLKKIVVETDSPLLLLSSEHQQALRHQGLRVLQISFPMLRSINRKYSSAGGHMHTNLLYRQEEDLARAAVVQQVQAAHWITNKSDVYIVVFDVFFKSKREDIDGPRKTHGDILQPTPSRAERQALSTKALLTAWYKQHPPAICNDSHIQQEIVIKHLSRESMLNCVATIYAFSEKEFSLLPLHQLLYQNLCLIAGISLDKKGYPT
jgi:hypothetical protein